MAKPPSNDPRSTDSRVTDLSRYRKQRAKAARRPPAQASRPSFLGANPRAGLILAVLAVVLAVVWLGPMALQLLALRNG